jgi:hypothetical protein
MIAEGMKVIVKGRDLIGVVDEIVDGVAYLTLSNKVEMDFPVDKLLPYSEVVGDAEAVAKPDIPDEWMNRHIAERVLVAAERMHDYANLSFGSRPSWNAASNRQRLNMIAVMIGYPSADALYEAVEAGKLSQGKIAILFALHLSRSISSAMPETPANV